MGVKGLTVFATHPKFDLVKGFAVDSLHCVFQGIPLDLLKLWFDQKHDGKDHSIRQQVCSHNYVLGN